MKPEIQAGGEDSSRLSAPIAQDSRNEKGGKTGQPIVAGKDLSYGTTLLPSLAELNKGTPAGVQGAGEADVITDRSGTQSATDGKVSK